MSYAGKYAGVLDTQYNGTYGHSTGGIPLCWTPKYNGGWMDIPAWDLIVGAHAEFYATFRGSASQATLFDGPTGAGPHVTNNALTFIDAAMDVWVNGVKVLSGAQTIVNGVEYNFRFVSKISGEVNRVGNNNTGTAPWFGEIRRINVGGGYFPRLYESVEKTVNIPTSLTVVDELNVVDSSAWTPHFALNGYVDIPTWSADIGDEIHTKVRVETSSNHQYILDSSTSNRAFLMVHSANTWAFPSALMEVYANGVQITAGSAFTQYGETLRIRIVFIQPCDITRIGARYSAPNTSVNYLNGRVWALALVKAGLINRLYTMLVNSTAAPTTTEVVDELDPANPGTLVASGWINDLPPTHGTLVNFTLGDEWTNITCPIPYRAYDVAYTGEYK